MNVKEKVALCDVTKSKGIVLTVIKVFFMWAGGISESQFENGHFKLPHLLKL